MVEYKLSVYVCVYMSLSPRTYVIVCVVVARMSFQCRVLSRTLLSPCQHHLHQTVLMSDEILKPLMKHLFFNLCGSNYT